MPTETVNDHDLFYVEDDFAPPWRPTREVVFLQPYLMGNHRDFWAYVPVLAQDFRVIRMDRVGNGLSAAPPYGYRYCLEELINDVKVFLDKRCIEKVHFVGESFGGILGAAFAANHPDRVASLVLSHTPYAIPAAAAQTFSRAKYESGAVAVRTLGEWAYAHLAWIERCPGLCEAGEEEMLALVYRAEQRALIPAHAFASMIEMVTAEGFGVGGFLNNVVAPTLLISPIRSNAMSDEEQRGILEAIPDCEQVFAERTEDFFTWKDPLDCARLCLDFIRRHTFGRPKNSEGLSPITSA